MAKKGKKKEVKKATTAKAKKVVEKEKLEEEVGKKEEADEGEEVEVIVKPTPEQLLAESQDKYLRLSAEFDNFRRRSLNEKMELVKTASSDVLTDILPVMDDFERAMKSMEEAKEVDPVKDGVVLIYNKFKEFLKQKGVSEIEAEGSAFDTDVHEAITKIPAPTKKMKGKVVDVIEKGYYLNDKIMRYAKVVVGE